jgi:hypothetical protein
MAERERGWDNNIDDGGKEVRDTTTTMMTMLMLMQTGRTMSASICRRLQG